MSKYIGTGKFSGRKEVYHTDRQCPQGPDKMREAPESLIDYHDLDECEYCRTGKYPNERGYSKDDSMYKELKRMGANNDP